MNKSDAMKDAGTGLVKAREALRKLAQTDITKAMEDTPQRREFLDALLAFNEATQAANPDLVRVEPARAQSAPSELVFLGAADDKLLHAKELENYLKDLAVAEGIAGYNAPRPYTYGIGSAHR